MWKYFLKSGKNLPDKPHFCRLVEGARGKGQRLTDRKVLGAENGDPRTIAQLLTDQVECANLIVLNKIDLIQEREAVGLEKLLKTLNPKASAHNLGCLSHG